MKSHRSNGFTLIELLIVLALIAILASLLYAAIGKVMQQARINITYQAVKNLETACRQYNTEYGYWPCSSSVSNQMDSGLMNILSGNGASDVPPWKGNPKNYVFLQATATNSSGALLVKVNPGANFWLLFDIAGTKQLARPDKVGGANPVETTGVLVWAINPNAVITDPNNNSAMYIGSWK